MIGELKPYSEYKDSGVSWLGEIPNHWELIRTKRIAKLNPSKTEAKSLLTSQTPVTFLPMTKVKVNGGIDAREILEASQVWNGFTYFRRSDVLVAKITPCFENGKGAHLENLPTEIGFGSTEFHVLRATPSVLPSFLYRCTTVPIFRQLGADAMTGAAGQQRVPLSFIADFPIALPSIPEQAAIAHFLNYADRRIRRYIRTKQRLIKLLEEQKQVVINEAVTQGTNPDVSYEDSGVEWLGTVPKHWEKLQLRRLITAITSGSRGWAEFYSDDGEIFLQSGNLGRSMMLNLSFIQHVNLPQNAEGMRTKVRKDDVLICITGALTGNVVLVDLDLPKASYINQHVALVRPNSEKVSPRFLAYCLHSRVGQNQFKTTEYGGTKQGLSLNDVKSVLVLVPSRNEQDEIVSYLDENIKKIEIALDEVEQEIILVREFRTRLIADVVTGKLDVREAAAKLPTEEDSEGSDLDPTEDDIGSEDDIDFDESLDDEAA